MPRVRTFDPTGRHVHTASSLGASVDYGHDGQGRLQEMSSGEWSAKWLRDSVGLEAERHHPARQVRARDVQERGRAQRGAAPPPLHVGHGQHSGKHVRLQLLERAVVGMQLAADGNGTLPLQKLFAIKRPFSICR